MAKALRSAAVVLLLSASCSAGQAVGLAWSNQAAGNAWHVELADVTGDGKREMVYACYDGAVCCQRQGSGEMVWTCATGAFPYDLATYDVDGDGRAETFVASSDGHLYAIGHDGSRRWVLETPAPLYQVALARVAQKPWIFTGGVERKLYVLNADGRVLKTFEYRRVVRLVRAGDLDGDGRDEVVVANHIGQVQALKGPALGTLWRARLRPIVDRKEIKGIWRPYSLCLDDLDRDGRCELLFGSGFYNACGVRLLGSDGQLLWDKPDGFHFRDGNHYSHTALVGCDVTPDQGREIVGLNARRLFVFNRKGKLLASAAASVSFTDIFVANSGAGQAEVVLASSPNGDDQVYRVRLSEGWKSAFAALDRSGQMLRITRNLDKLREQIAAYRGAAAPTGKYIITVSGGQPNTPRKIRSHFGVFDFYRKHFPYDNCVFTMTINVAAKEGVPGFFRPDKRTMSRRVPAADIPELLKTAGHGKVHFLVAVGHGCEPQITLETAEEILRACPRYCLGFMCSENTRYDERLEHYLVDYWYPLMDICKRHGKKAILIEKGAWWATIPAMKRFRKLVDGTYADVLVMSVEDSNSRCPELNLAGRAGLFLTGACNTWSARSISDELCWNRYWEWEFPMTGHPFLRRQMAQALLGARVFEFHLHMHTLGRDRAFTRLGEESSVMLIHMLGKGLLVPPRPDDMLGLSPVAIRMREPNASFLAEAYNMHQHQRFTVDLEEGGSPFEGLACHWGAAPVRKNYVGSYLFGQDRHYGTFVPATRFGFPAIVPAFIEMKRLPWAKSAWATDGRWLYDGEERLSGVDARPRVLDSLRRGAEQLPFRAEGHVFMQAQTMGEDAVRLTLIDPGFLDPADRDVTLRVQSKRAVRELVDLLTGKPIQLAKGRACFTVPAGAFRILEARY